MLRCVFPAGRVVPCTLLGVRNCALLPPLRTLVPSFLVPIGWLTLPAFIHSLTRAVLVPTCPVHAAHNRAFVRLTSLARSLPRRAILYVCLSRIQHRPCFIFTERFVRFTRFSHPQALLKNLDDTSSTADVLECLAACPQLCSEDRRALAGQMEPITTPLRNWLLGLEGGAPPLRGPRSSSPPTAPSAAAAAATTKTSARRGKGKGSKGKGKGGGGGSGSGSGSGATPPGEPAGQEPEVEAEFFSQGRRGEGNRWSTRQSPELSKVITHNLVVLLSALHRASPGGVGAGVGDDDSSPTQPITREDRSAGADDDNDDDVVDDNSSTPTSAAGSQLLAAVDAGGRLAQEQELVFGLAEPLLDACMQVAARRASPQLFGTVVETKALLRRRLWSSEDPSALDRQQKEVDVEFDAAVPSIKVCMCVCVFGECGLFLVLLAAGLDSGGYFLLDGNA